MEPIDSGRITRTFTQHIEAPPERVFPLLCPVREGEWLDSWRDEMEMIHTDSGFAEDGCVFRTRVAGRPETLWMIVRHDPVGRVVEFARFTIGLVATRLTIRVEGAGAGTSRVQIAYTVTPLGAEGRRFAAEAFSAEAFRANLLWWEKSMNHWLESGEILRAPA